MTEYAAVVYLHRLAEISGRYVGVVYTAITQRRTTSPDNRHRATRGTAYTLPTAPGIRSGWVPGAARNATTQRTERMVISGRVKGRTYPAKTSKVSGMFTERDRIPRIGVHQTVTGYGIPNVDVLISGKQNTTAAKTDGRGIWWAYLPVDDYSKASIRSFGGTAIYELLEQKERLPDDPYIWDEIMKRKTNNSTGFRMISRFV